MKVRRIQSEEVDLSRERTEPMPKVTGDVLEFVVGEERTLQRMLLRASEAVQTHQTDSLYQILAQISC